MFRARQWPRIDVADADLLGRLIDEFLRSSTDIGPAVGELIELSGSQPSNPDRPIWLWLAEWSSVAGRWDEPLLALKIAAFTLAWPDRGGTALLHPLDPTSGEFDLIRRSAIAAARQLPDATVFRTTDELTVPRLTAYLYGPGSRSRGRNGLRPPPADPRCAGLGTDRLALLEDQCGYQWDTFLELLAPDEPVHAAVPVMSFDIRVSVLALTDRRLVIVSAPKYLVGTPTYAEIDLADVLTVRYHHGSLGDHHTAAMTGGVRDAYRSLRQLAIESRTGDHMVNFRVHGTPKNEGAEWPTLILRQQRAPSQPASPQPAPPQPAAPDLAGQLEKLGQLHRAGILTETEFAAAKARLLS